MPKMVQLFTLHHALANLKPIGLPQLNELDGICLYFTMQRNQIGIHLVSCEVKQKQNFQLIPKNGAVLEIRLKSV